MAHHTSTGCNLAPGDLLGTGTLSSADPDGAGCLLEMTLHGTKPKTWSDDIGHEVTRGYLEDGDVIILTGHCQKDGYPRIGFGQCIGRLLPGRP